MRAQLTDILSSTDIKKVYFRNRLAVAPMTRISATEAGQASKAMLDYYARFAAGGFGLVITEGLYTDSAFSQGYPFQPGMASEVQAKGWIDITDAIHRNGAVVFAQVMHAGALSQSNRFRAHTVGPSAIQPTGKQMTAYYGEGKYPQPMEITEMEIAEVIQGFVDSAVRAVHVAGFDGIEIHGANGYLLDQFLSAESNQRKDKWGGDIHGRVSLTIEVLKAVKAALPKEIPVGVRISQGKVNDFTSKWAGGEADAAVVFSALAQAGADFIHVTEFEAWKPAFKNGNASLVELARKYAPHVALIANGGLHDNERATQVLAQGSDILALGRGALSNPDLPQMLEKQQALRPFDPSVLSPVANIKDSELSFG